MELDVEQLDRLLRWRRIALWIILAVICGGLVIALAIYSGSRAGSGDQSDSDSESLLNAFTFLS
jgi:hypothetical protein